MTAQGQASAKNQAEANRLREMEARQLGNYRQQTLGLDQNALGLKIAALNETIRSNSNLDAYRDREQEIAEKKLGIEQQLLTLRSRESEARATQDEAQAGKLREETKRLSKINDITDRYLSGQVNSGLAAEVARDALGLGSNSAQARLRANDLTNTELGIIESPSQGGEDTFKIYNRKFLGSASDSINYFYIYDDGFLGDEVKQISLANGKTLGDVKAQAKRLGISAEDALKQIYEAQKR